MPKKKSKTATRARFICIDCPKDTSAAEEYYMVWDDVWAKANPDLDGMLCLSCLETRLGRPLCASDFTNAPVNEMQALVCLALRERLDTPGKPSKNHKAFRFSFTNSRLTP